MSNDTQGTPALAFQPGEATFTALHGHTLHLEVGTDYIAASVRVDGADDRQPLVSIYGYSQARSPRINRTPVLVINHTYLRMPADAHAAAVAFLTEHGAYLRTEVDA